MVRKEYPAEASESAFGPRDNGTSPRDGAVEALVTGESMEIFGGGSRDSGTATGDCGDSASTTSDRPWDSAIGDEDSAATAGDRESESVT